MTVLAVLGGGVALVGAALVLVAAVGVHRFDAADVRLHVAAKASSAGLLLVLVGLALRSGSFAAGVELALTGVFVVLTIPIATHALARARFDGEATPTAAPAPTATSPAPTPTTDDGDAGA